jgi:hypothetical protein
MNGDYSAVWGTSYDVQPTYYTQPDPPYNVSLVTEGATHGSKAVQVTNLPADGTYPDVMEFIMGSNSPAMPAFIHASAMKFDITFDRANFPGVQATNTYSAEVVSLNTPALADGSGGGYVTGKPSYDNLSVMNSAGKIIQQDNYEAGQWNALSTAVFPNQTTTISVTLDFTTNRRNGADATGGGASNGDGYDPPNWKKFHQDAVTQYNIDPANFYAIFHLQTQVGFGFDSGGIIIDNIRFIQPGDFNQDGHVDAQDIALAEKAYADPSAYEAQFNMTGNNKDYDLKLIADVNGDGVVSNADLQKLLLNLKAGQGTSSSVPEPASLTLLGLGGVLFLARCRRRRSA